MEKAKESGIDYGTEFFQRIETNIPPSCRFAIENTYHISAYQKIIEFLITQLKKTVFDNSELRNSIDLQEKSISKLKATISKLNASSYSKRQYFKKICS